MIIKIFYQSLARLLHLINILSMQKKKRKKKERVFFIVVEAVFSSNSVLLFHTLFIISDISFIFLFEARLFMNNAKRK